MRIATWNMDDWRRSEELKERAWTFLRERVAPDVALLQEGRPHGELAGSVFRSGGIRDERGAGPKDLGWGSAVVSFGPSLEVVADAHGPFRTEPNPILRTFPGSVAVAEVEGAEPLVDERRARRMVIARDLNITTQWSVKHRSFLRGYHEECLARDRELFERFEALGFHNLVRRSDEQGPLPGCDCTEGTACRHVQTQRHERSSFPWQDDYIFVTADILERKPVLTVFDEGDAWDLSGHCPVAIEWHEAGAR